MKFIQNKHYIHVYSIILRFNIIKIKLILISEITNRRTFKEKKEKIIS